MAVGHHAASGGIPPFREGVEAATDSALWSWRWLCGDLEPDLWLSERKKGEAL